MLRFLLLIKFLVLILEARFSFDLTLILVFGVRREKRFKVHPHLSCSNPETQTSPQRRLYIVFVSLH